jgi:hypothetical protein
MPDLSAIFSAAALTDDVKVRQQGIGFVGGAISGIRCLWATRQRWSDKETCLSEHDLLFQSL